MVMNLKFILSSSLKDHTRYANNNYFSNKYIIIYKRLYQDFIINDYITQIRASSLIKQGLALLFYTNSVKDTLYLKNTLAKMLQL